MVYNISLQGIVISYTNKTENQLKVKLKPVQMSQNFLQCTPCFVILVSGFLRNCLVGVRKRPTLSKRS